MNRRDLIKFFGAGAVVAPLVNGMPQGEAIIVKPPVVELPPEPKVLPVSAFMGMDEMEVVVFMRNPRLKEAWRMDCTAFISSMRTNPIEITSWTDSRPHFLPGPAEITLQITGDVKVFRK